MMNGLRPRRVLPRAALPCAALLLAAAAGPAPGAGPWTSWKAGDSWEVAVERYPSAGVADAAPARYALHVTVAGTGRVGAADCWLVTFQPLPSGYRAAGKHPYTVYLDREAGWVRRVTWGADKDVVPAPIVETLGDGTVLTAAPDGVPLELFPHAPRKLSPRGSLTSLTLLASPEGRATAVESALGVRGKEEIVVRQRWVAGGKWWQDYERIVRGRKDLHARLAKALPPTGEAVAAARADGGSPLRKDPRLQAPVTLEAEHPTLEEVLERLRAATGLSFAVDESLARHAPAFGSVQLRRARAWAVMELVAATDLQGGEWRPEEGGYRLVARASLREREVSTPLWRHPLAVTAAALALMLLIAVAARARAARRKAPPGAAAAAPAGKA
jgi:hypothetical protein